MFIPPLNTLCFAKLYEDHEPLKIIVNHVDVTNPELLNITVFFTGRDSEERDIDTTENGFRIFDCPIDSKYFYIIVSHEDDGYDNTNDYEMLPLMNLDEAMETAESLNITNSKADHDVVVRRIKT